jgi:hypothetical protein
MMSQEDEAFRMLDAFASVGAAHFDLTHIDIDGQNRGFRPRQTIGQLKNSLPRLFPSAEERKNNIIVRPHSEKTCLMQLDDLDKAGISRVGEVAFLTLETSPGNHQTWVAVSGLIDPQEARDFARRLRKGTGADATASGATRIAGTTNYKRKYEPDFPQVSIFCAAPGRVVSPARVEALGLVAKPDPLKPTTVFPLRVSRRHEDTREWPDYQRCLEHAPPNHNNTGPDASRADFVWCMMALKWGHGIDETANRLLQMSPKAQENGERYAIRTATNAAAAVQRNEHGRGRG